ncbi:MAG: hypothetical protein P1U38_09560 [Aeromicrobium sp.]|uniref:hypothetical protein n=1 Tax=Aeromicrobium sp. TaxID=1871063 RepID=UPI0026304C16|nr:hypothetical protein [Aeromicrobium sp.]MDF1705007.1 hypothetical protein [Aeromicrobium sp.]
MGITVAGLSSPAVVSVQVSWRPNEWHNVIGAKEVQAFGSAFFRDHLVPLNTEATYRVVVHSGSMTGSDTATITVTSDWTWIQDPRDPRSALRVTCEGGDDDGERGIIVGSFAAAQYRQAMDLAQPLGARLPVASLGQRLMAGEVPLVVSYDVAAEGGELQRLLMDAGQLVIRGHHYSMLDDVAHVAIGDAQERRELIVNGTPTNISTWDLSATSVRQGNLKIAIAWWTYGSVASLWSPSTYAEAEAARPGRTYLDWQADPDLP